MANPASSTDFQPTYPPTANPPASDSQGSGSGLGKKVTSTDAKPHISSSSEERSAWKSVSSFFKGLYARTIKLINYVSKHINEMLPPYLKRVGGCCVVGFIIGALTPVGPLWGTVGGLLLATGWQLCVECNTDRDKPKTP
ncbi:hypothetical protein [Endozoicomonas sp.]|uniref:hypothetical protein n=1 Tax=Endozoicomonas sp. TaxID=1892382 RepID=UPI002887CA2D|nr:hypothetical protein [Endozoicomonas sp.]